MFSKNEVLRDHNSIMCLYHWADRVVLTVIVHDKKETFIFFVSDII